MWVPLLPKTEAFGIHLSCIFLHDKGVPTSAEVGKATRLDCETFLKKVLSKTFLQGFVRTHLYIKICNLSN